MDRFWEKVNVAPPTECWNWTGFTNLGYGWFWIGKGKSMTAHRFIFEKQLGRDLGRHEFVCHHCDNRQCVNPAHLFLGSQGDNMQDMISKGRSPHIGEMNTNAKLTNEKVRQIRARRAAGGVTQQALAAEYGVSQAVISAIELRKTWRQA